MKKQKIMTLWLVRDKTGFKSYSLFDHVPTLDNDGEWDREYMKAFCCNQFEEITGFHLRPGGITQIRVTLLKNGGFSFVPVKVKK